MVERILEKQGVKGIYPGEYVQPMRARSKVSSKFEFKILFREEEFVSIVSQQFLG